MTNILKTLWGMNKIFLMIFFCVFLTACNSIQIKPVDKTINQSKSEEIINISDNNDLDRADNLKQMIETANKYQKSAEIYLISSQNKDEMILDIMIKNHDMAAIQSARSWLVYNPEYIEVLDINTELSDFDLSVAGENEINKKLGLIMLGRSKAGESLTNLDIKVGTLVLKVKKPGMSIIDFYDYNIAQDGHVQANVVQDGRSVNILNKPKSPALLIQ